MSEHGSGTYAIQRWDETTWDGQPWNEAPGLKVTHSIVLQTFSGVIEGQARCQQLLAYSSDTYASFVGLHQVTGRVQSRTGSFVLQSNGTYADSVVQATWFVVPGSGTGELAGLRGQGTYTAVHADYPNVPYHFEYTFEDSGNPA